MSEVRKLPDMHFGSLNIQRLDYGGYVVTAGDREPGLMVRPLFASAEIDEALSWMSGAMTGTWAHLSPSGDA